MKPQSPESFFTGSSKLATVRRGTPKTRKKASQKDFRLGLLAGLVFPLLREGDGAVFDFSPREWHQCALMGS